MLQGLPGRCPFRWNGVVYSPTEGGSGVVRPKGRILIVEDEYFVALDLEHRLTGAGFEVVGIASTAEEAAELAASAKPDLAVMDIRLAGPRDGVEAALELLIDHGVPSIFATAHTDAKTRARAEQAKPLGWLQKPYSADSVISLLITIVEKRS